MAEKARRRSKGDGTIRQRSDGTWEGRVPVGKNPVTGKTQYKAVYAKTMKEVREKIKQIGNNPDEIVTPNGVYRKVEERTEATSLLFSDWLDTWMTQYKAKSLVPASYESYRVFIEHHIKPVLGNIPITEITTSQIQEFLNAMQENGVRKDGREGALANSSVMKIKIIINASLKQAVKNRLIPFNPTEAVTPPKMTRRKIRVLTPEEQDKFMNALNGHRLEALYKLALATGMRKGELLALTWDCIDFENKIISISKSVNRVRNQGTMKTEIVVGGPKSKAGYRDIIMLPAVAPILEKHLQMQRDERKAAGSAYNKLGLVFCSNVGTHIDPRRVNTTLDKLLKKAGIEHINFHALRHTFATRALESGIPAKIVQEMLGHADVALTLNNYTHPLKDTMRAEMMKMNDVFKNRAVKAKENDKDKEEPERER